MISEEFFSNLEEGQEYYSLFVGQEGYDRIPLEVRECMVINEIRQTNNSFTDDPIHKDLLKKYTKAKRELRNYEYKKNK